MPKMFGTDGVRGLANRDLTARLALDLGDAAVRVLGDAGTQDDQPEGRRRALVGRDTRVSGDFLASALSAGMAAGGDRPFVQDDLVRADAGGAPGRILAEQAHDRLQEKSRQAN